MTDKRNIDGHKLVYYPRETARVLDGDTKHSLLQVEIGVTNSCNNRCIYCSLENVGREGTNVGTGELSDALGDMGDMGVKAVYFAGEGEPLIHKSFPKFVKKAANLGMGTALASNGTLLTERISEEILPYMSWMRIGVDASTPETYAKVHGVLKENFQKVIKNIGDAVKVKQRGNLPVDIDVQCIALPHNIGEIEGLAKIVRDLGIERLQVKPYAHHPQANEKELFVDPHSPEMKELQHNLEEYNSQNFTVVYRINAMERVSEEREASERPYMKCEGLNYWTLLSARGEVIPCNLFYDNKDFSFGNIHEKSFKDIWEGKQREEVMEKIAKLDKNKVCKGYTCRPDLLNIHMHRLRNPSPADRFI